MRDVIRRLRTTVHPDLALLLHPLNLRVDLHQPLRGIVEIRGDAEVADATEAVSRWMRLALMFQQRQQRGVPGVGLPTRRVVDRQSRVVADVRSWDTLGLVLVKDRRPDAAQIDLSKRSAWHCERCQENR